ncbi:hypothetical protein ACLOJK_036004 [Asimina triloba]
MWDGIGLDSDEADTESVYDSEEEEGGGDSEYSPDKVSENESATAKTKGYWQPAEIDLPPKYSPEAVTEYTKKSSQRYESSVGLRLHLLALGWKIEYKEEPQKARYRYTSPNGRSFYSLCKVCEYLKEQDMDGQNGSLCGEEQEYSDGIMEQVQSPGVTNHSPAGKKTGFSAHGTAKEERSVVCYSSYPVMKRRSLRRPRMFIEPKYCPPAITYYCRLETSKGKFENNDPNLDMKQLRLNAKRHLLHDGWHLRYVPKAGRQELRYISPTSKSYYSLLTACKSWMEKGGNLHEFGKLTIGEDLESSHSAQIVCAGFMGNFSRLIPPNESVGQETKEDGHNALNVAVGSKKSLTCPSGKLEDSGMLSQPLPEQNDKLEDSGMLKSGKLSQSLPEQNDTAGSNQRMLRSGKLYKEFIRRDKRSAGASPLLRCGKGSKDPKTKRETQSGCSKQSTEPHNRQRQQNTRLCSLIDNGVVFLGQRVWYRQNVHRTPMAEGKITREGIECVCCGATYTLSKFEAHAKSTKHRPAAHIFLKDGRSLLQCQMELGIPYKLPGKKINGAASIPNGDDQNNGSALIPNGDDQTNGPAPIFNGDDICTICHFGGTSFGAPMSCQKENGFAHVVGVAYVVRVNLMVTASSLRRQYYSVTNVSVNRILLADISPSMQPSREIKSNTCRRSKGINDHIPPTTSDKDLAAFNKKICAALQVMNECFGHIVEPIRSRDLITDVLTNRRSDLNRLNFQGFYTMILEKGEEVVSAAAIRIYGEKVAEMPLICTQFKYRQQGMCHLLMEELEKMLCDIGVERLFLPSIREMLDIWRTGFGFTKLTASDRMAFLHHTTMCQKLLLMHTPTKRTGRRCLRDYMGVMTNQDHGDMVAEEDDVQILQQRTALDLLSAQHTRSELVTELSLMFYKLDQAVQSNRFDREPLVARSD